MLELNIQIVRFKEPPQYLIFPYPITTHSIPSLLLPLYCKHEIKPLFWPSIKAQSVTKQNVKQTFSDVNIFSKYMPLEIAEVAISY